MARRVRTGCVTCRKRRVKCDERRPACERCRNANFECEGFEAPRKISSLARRDSSSPEASSPERVLELPWRQSTWRPNQLPLYHHFITSTVVRLFRVDHVSFWRDRVAQMSFNIESVYEALLAVGAAHRAILLSCSGDNRKEIMRCKVLGFGAYGRTLRLLATNMSRDTANDPWPVLIVLVLCTYFECFMGNSKAALRHLWAAIQVVRKSESQLSVVDLGNMVPVYEVMLRLDFLACKQFPYAASSFSSCSDLALMELPFWSRRPISFSANIQPDAIANERHRLMQIISGHHKLSRVVWGCWYPASERPTRAELMGFYNEVQLWKATSPATFSSCPDSDSLFATSLSEFKTLPMPPLPLYLASADAAINIMMFNGYMGCSLAMIANTDEDPVARDIEAFNYVYQNLRIAASLLYGDSDNGPADYKPCDSLDRGISMFLFHAARRCYSVGWQKWTATALRSIGQEGVTNAYALANIIDMMHSMETPYVYSAEFEGGTELDGSPLGSIRDRLIPLPIPRDDNENFSAYFLHYGLTELGNDERVVRIIGRASWKQNETGEMRSLELDAYDIDDARMLFSKDDCDDKSVLSTIRQQVEYGWHGVL